MKILGKTTSHWVIQLGVLSAGKVKPRQLRSFRNDWMSFSRFWTKLFLGTHPHNFLTGWNARYCQKRLNGFALYTYRRTKPTFWIKLFILSHELTRRQPLTLRNGCKFKSMRLSEQTNKWNDGFIQMYPPEVKHGNGKSPIWMFSEVTFICRFPSWPWLPKRSHRSPSPSLFSCRHDIHGGFTSLACAEHAKARILQCHKDQDGSCLSI